MMRRCAPPNQAMGGSNSGEGTPDTSMRRVEVEVRRLLWSRPIRALSIRGVTTSSTSVRGSSQWTLSSCCIPSPPHRCYGAFPCCTRCVPSRLWASQSRSWAPRPRALVSMRRSPPLRSPFSRSVWGRFSSGWKVWGDKKAKVVCRPSLFRMQRWRAVLFGEEADSALLGAVTLVELGLSLHPTRHELEPRPLILAAV